MEAFTFSIPAFIRTGKPDPSSGMLSGSAENEYEAGARRRGLSAALPLINASSKPGTIVPLPAAAATIADWLISALSPALARVP